VSYTLGTDTVPSQIYVEGYDLGQGTVTLTLKDPSGGTAKSDMVKFSVVRPNLTGYRPQTEGPGYGSPFAKTPVPWQKETDPGVGIRFNGDDDDADGTADYDPNDTSIAGENDLIEVNVAFAAPPGVQYRLLASNQNIRGWAGSDKSGVFHLDGNYILTSPGNFWIEWVQPDVTQAADLRVRVYDGTHGNFVFVGDRLHFYPFTSVVIVLGGESQVPADPVNFPGDHGMFQTAIDEYRNGYDVHMYDEDEAGIWGEGAAYDEVVTAINDRGLTDVAIMGYSHGGGSTHNLAWRLEQNTIPGGLTDIANPFVVPYTAYVDAIVDHDTSAENRRPPLSAFHCNQYQQNSWLKGGPSNGNDDLDRSHLGVSHTTIDDHSAVTDLLKARLEQNVDR
jgi:hypothetical protein